MPVPFGRSEFRLCLCEAGLSLRDFGRCAVAGGERELGLTHGFDQRHGQLIVARNPLLGTERVGICLHRLHPQRQPRGVEREFRLDAPALGLLLGSGQPSPREEWQFHIDRSRARRHILSHEVEEAAGIDPADTDLRIEAHLRHFRTTRFVESGSGGGSARPCSRQCRRMCECRANYGVERLRMCWNNSHDREQ